MERKNMNSTTVESLDGILRNHESFLEAAVLTNNQKMTIPIYKIEEKDGNYIRSESTDVVLELYQEDAQMGSISPAVKVGKFGLILKDNLYRIDMVDVSSYASEFEVESISDAKAYFREKFGHDDLNNAYEKMGGNWKNKPLPTEIARQTHSDSLDFLVDNKYKSESKTHFDKKITPQDIEYSIQSHLDDMNFLSDILQENSLLVDETEA